VHEAEKLSLEQIQAFLNASQAMRFEREPKSRFITGSNTPVGRSMTGKADRRAVCYGAI
jgi:hypothetical protein